MLAATACAVAGAAATRAAEPPKEVAGSVTETAVAANGVEEGMVVKVHVPFRGVYLR